MIKRMNQSKWLNSQRGTDAQKTLTHLRRDISSPFHFGVGWGWGEGGCVVFIFQFSASRSAWTPTARIDYTANVHHRIFLSSYECRVTKNHDGQKTRLNDFTCALFAGQSNQISALHIWVQLWRLFLIESLCPHLWGRPIKKVNRPLPLLVISLPKVMILPFQFEICEKRERFICIRNWRNH